MVAQCAASDMYHSKVKVTDGGGEIVTKILRNVDSFEREIQLPNETITTLRDFVYGKKDKKTGKHLIMSMKPSPTSGNKNSIRTEFTAYRSKDHEETKYLANEAQKYILTELAQDVWNTFGKDTAQQILAASICQLLAMDNIVNLEEEARGTPFMDLEIPEMVDFTDDLTQTDNTEWDNASAKTTASTKDRLKETQQRLDDKEQEMNEMKKQTKDQSSQLEQQRSEINELNKKMTLLLKSIQPNQSSEDATCAANARAGDP